MTPHTGPSPDHLAFNTWIQNVQTEAKAIGLEFRVRTVYSAPDRRERPGRFGMEGLPIYDKVPTIIAADIEVFWTEWQCVGRQSNPMTPEVRFATYPQTWDRIKFEAAHEIAKG